ncbi:fructolike protein [Perilla frutescens var. hirtella]|uniref:Fructolike protein n=1 Tax=Perilla frutescens var. hirtella TaxID=608512 RepID=A0AAD4IX10_PERFH|nr:fructolike protein [Perilla frutescens var. hirtella]
MAASRSKTTGSSAEKESDGETGSVEKKTRKTSKRASAKTRKKVIEIPAEISAVNDSVRDEELPTIEGSTEDLKKTKTRTRRKAPSTPKASEEDGTKKQTRQRRRSKKADDDVVRVDSQGSEIELSDGEGDMFISTLDEDSEEELELNIDDGEDISFTYGWPPLVCCFGAAQHAFVPAGRRANRLLDYEIHESKKNVLWQPEKFVRASGGCASNVAVALASLGGKVAFMGKLGDDSFGQSLLYFLNTNRVQTRSVRIDDNKETAVSHMKIGKRGGLKMTSAKPCAEDCLSRSEINIDVLKEAQMFYFNTFSLLDRNMRSTTLQAVKIAKKLENVIFFDLNLPLPLWQSSEETKMFIHRAWNLADIIEVTKQELEFLLGITPSEKFDTKDNCKSKFTHYAPEVVSQLWHDNLKILFVTNGTSKIHYYTKEHNGAVLGMEDAPITPYTSDMSASGDGVVAGLMRMLTVQPHLISDKGYLEKTIKYAINCGVIDQWLQARALGYPAKEGMDDVVSDAHGIRSITEKEYRTLVPSSS